MLPENRVASELGSGEMKLGPALETLALAYNRNVALIVNFMKSAYELAMEKLNKTSPTVRLTDQQKKELAELESRCQAKTADRELFLKGEIVKAIDKGDQEAVEQLEKQLVSERKSIRADFDEKKDRVRAGGKP
jgi:hypothetical protein